MGDNSAVRGSVTIYRVEEPSVSDDRTGQDASLSVSDSIQLTYPDGARDAETLMVDPQDEAVYVVSKREARLYASIAWQAMSGQIQRQLWITSTHCPGEAP